jgi:hypothetical protein
MTKKGKRRKSMTNYELFLSLNEPFGAGLFEFEDSAPIIRYANALKRFYEVAPLPKYEGGNIYPSGRNSYLISPYFIRPQYTHALEVNFSLLMKKNEKACELMREEFGKVRGFMVTSITWGDVAGLTPSPTIQEFSKKVLTVILRV